MRGFVIGIVATAIAFAILVNVLPNSMVEFSGKLDKLDGVIQLVILAAIFGVVNALIKPAAKLLSFPISMMTLGLFGIVINAALLLVTAWVADTYAHVGFRIGGFPTHGITADTIVGAIVASVALAIISTLVGLVVHD